MPRKGRGSKTQPVQTETGQEYGSALRQEEAQMVQPLPLDVDPAVREFGPRRPRPTAGQAGDPFRGTDRPGQPIATLPASGVAPPLPPERAHALPSVLHIFYAMANSAYADPDMQDVVRRMEGFVPTKYDQTL